MTKLEKLQQNYEDAAFALMMYHIAAQRGAEAVRENELLRADSETAVPPQLRQRCRRTIRRQFTRQQTQTVRRVLGRAVNRVAVAVLVMVLLFTTAFAASPDFRAHTLNLLVENFGDRTRFQLTETAAPTGLDSYDIQAGWLPEGFVKVDRINGQHNVAVRHTNNDGHVITIVLYRLDQKSVSLDSESGSVTPVLVQDNSAWLIQKDNLTQVAWTIDEKGIICSIRYEGPGTVNVLQIAENTIIT